MVCQETQPHAILGSETIKALVSRDRKEKVTPKHWCQIQKDKLFSSLLVNFFLKLNKKKWLISVLNRVNSDCWTFTCKHTQTHTSASGKYSKIYPAKHRWEENKSVSSLKMVIGNGNYYCFPHLIRPVCECVSPHLQG